MNGAGNVSMSAVQLTYSAAQRAPRLPPRYSRQKDKREISDGRRAYPRECSNLNAVYKAINGFSIAFTGALLRSDSKSLFWETNRLNSKKLADITS